MRAKREADPNDAIYKIPQPCGANAVFPPGTKLIYLDDDGKPLDPQPTDEERAEVARKMKEKQEEAAKAMKVHGSVFHRKSDFPLNVLPVHRSGSSSTRPNAQPRDQRSSCRPHLARKWLPHEAQVRLEHLSNGKNRPVGSQYRRETRTVPTQPRRGAPTLSARCQTRY